MSIKFPAHGDITKLFPDGQVGLHDIMILKKISEKCNSTDFGHKPMSRKNGLNGSRQTKTSLLWLNLLNFGEVVILNATNEIGEC